MIPVKIQCECGQRYAFDVEPVDGRLPSAVACPVCGADGTAAGNAAIAQSVPAQPMTAASRGAPLRVAVAAHSDHLGEPAASPAPHRSPRLPGQIERSQAEHEARAKISWGDPPEEVIKYLMIQGFSAEEASALVKDMFRERAATIRGDGIKKIAVGIALMCVPIVAFFIFMSIGVIYTKILAITIMLGLWGMWTAIKGIFMAVAPKSQSGDVAEQ
jgi:hypothetical protein